MSGARPGHPWLEGMDGRVGEEDWEKPSDGETDGLDLECLDIQGFSE